MSRDVRRVSDLPTGTVVILPEELGRLAGYAEGGGSTSVLVPGHKSLDAVALLPSRTLVEVVAYPQELANAYLKGELARVDRRWRGSRKKKDRPAGVSTTPVPGGGEGASEGDAA